MVIQAAEAADIHNHIQSLPDAYQTLVGESGLKMSGGQRQRIGIARALYKDPSVLIFDESTSALDRVTEARIMEAIIKLRGEKTIIFSTHRLELVESCDEVIMMSGGEIIAQGTPTSLRNSNDVFRKYLNACSA